MAIVRFDPFAELNALHEQMNSLFNSGFSQAPGGRLPTMDISSDDKALTVEMHVPNFKEEEVMVNVHEGVLEVKGEHKETDEEKDGKKKYLQRESVSQFYRSIALPRTVDAEAIKAHLEDGVLKVTAPYKELPQPKKIKITKKASKK
jgi:HSP20 family protein